MKAVWNIRVYLEACGDPENHIVVSLGFESVGLSFGSR